MEIFWKKYSISISPLEKSLVNLTCAGGLHLLVSEVLGNKFSMQLRTAQSESKK